MGEAYSGKFGIDGVGAEARHLVSDVIEQIIVELW